MKSLELPHAFASVHSHISESAKIVLQSTAFLYALIEILEKKGLITIDELDEKKRQIALELINKYSRTGILPVFQDPEVDKYSFTQSSAPPCDQKLPVCKAICCKMPFALSKQDVDEGIVRWDFKRPYAIAHGEDGYCLHLDRETYRCTIHESRPVPCRGFDCRSEERWNVWENYEGDILSDTIEAQIGEGSACWYQSK